MFVCVFVSCVALTTFAQKWHNHMRQLQTQVTAMHIYTYTYLHIYEYMYICKYILIHIYVHVLSARKLHDRMMQQLQTKVTVS